MVWLEHCIINLFFSLPHLVLVLALHMALALTEAKRQKNSMVINEYETISITLNQYPPLVFAD